MTNVTILRQYQAAQLNAQGKSEYFVVIDFNVGDDGPFTVSIAKSEFTADVARQQIQALAMEVEQLRNL